MLGCGVKKFLNDAWERLVSFRGSLVFGVLWIVLGGFILRKIIFEWQLLPYTQQGSLNVLALVGVLSGLSLVVIGLLLLVRTIVLVGLIWEPRQPTVRVWEILAVVLNMALLLVLGFIRLYKFLLLEVFVFLLVKYNRLSSRWEYHLSAYRNYLKIVKHDCQKSRGKHEE